MEMDLFKEKKKAKEAEDQWLLWDKDREFWIAIIWW